MRSHNKELFCVGLKVDDREFTLYPVIKVTDNINPVVMPKYETLGYFETIEEAEKYINSLKKNY
tara:strand:+ start:1427 stop:1618 length:192 start_codon:yes stop_codon:yes gene_type:complete